MVYQINCIWPEKLIIYSFQNDSLLANTNIFNPENTCLPCTKMYAKINSTAHPVPPSLFTHI